MTSRALQVPQTSLKQTLHMLWPRRRLSPTGLCNRVTAAADRAEAEYYVGLV